MSMEELAKSLAVASSKGGSCNCGNRNTKRTQSTCC